MRSAEAAPVDRPEAEQGGRQRRVRRLLLFYSLVLIVVGFSTFPLQPEVALLERVAGTGSLLEMIWPAMAHWLSTVAAAIREGYGAHSLLQYGTDWLAFAHIVIGIAFLGAAREPVRNVWVVEWGMIACMLVIPTALIFGAIRDIPFFWRLIDCAFGVLGSIPLWIAHRNIQRLVISNAVSSSG